MGKAVIFSVLIGYLLTSCCKEEPAIHLNEGSDWFTEITNFSNIDAKSQDSMVEAFRVHFSKSETSNYVNDCQEISSTSSVSLSYSPDIYNEYYFYLSVSGFSKGDIKLSITSGIHNLYSYRFDEPNRFNYLGENFTNPEEDLGNCVRYIGDSAVNGDAYKDIYRISVPSSITKGNLKDLIFSKSYGVIQFERKDGTLWRLDAK
jgi:hypothetical protein